MGENLNGLRDDKINVKFNDRGFFEILEKWKFFCRSLKGGQTERLQMLISKDLPKLKEEVLEKQKGM